ncbi:glutathione S-transferase family protein [Roseibium algae]|uniref:Glutathione S-transferase family protein n=1 Tax=Roseibium algae TaxID=3123038 RepID=A0ABU8TIY0_9HYPH
MREFELFIGNKNYSSWSFRPWIGLKHKNIPFKEELVPFDFENGNPKFKAFSPTVKVPVLKDNDLTVWESLAILEYAADAYPGAGLWPTDIAMRAKARSACSEMVSGFSALRNACPMNMRREPMPLAVDAAVRKDVARIVSLWRECLEASGGPFLFGDFTIADAMYAPVVSRFETFMLTDDKVALAYMDRMIALPAWQEWRAAALQESWIVAEDEV